MVLMEEKFNLVETNLYTLNSDLLDLIPKRFILMCCNNHFVITMFCSGILMIFCSRILLAELIGTTIRILACKQWNNSDPSPRIWTHLC